MRGIRVRGGRTATALSFPLTPTLSLQAGEGDSGSSPKRELQRAIC